MNLFNQYITSNFTDRETLTYTGTLPPDRLEHLVTQAERLEDLQNAHVHAEEALAQYPAEDFLAKPISLLHDLRQSLRGSNRETVSHIIEVLDDIAQCQHYSTEYGLEELHKLIKILKA